MWQETSHNRAQPLSNAVQEISFRISCPQLPVDHAQELCTALRSALPWLEEETNAGIHSIHVAASSNGWARPDAKGDQLLQLSKRTRLVLRLPAHRVEDARVLSEKILILGDYVIKVGKPLVKPLTPSTTIFSRSVETSTDEDETAFIQRIANELGRSSIHVQRMMCGLQHTINAKPQLITARSVLIDDLSLPDSIRLQQVGVGEKQLMGCGLFLPHKSLAAVGNGPEDEL